VGWRRTAAVVGLGLVELLLWLMLLRVWGVRRGRSAVALVLRRRGRVVWLRRVLALRLVIVGLRRVVVLRRLIVVLLLLIALLTSLMASAASTVVVLIRHIVYVFDEGRKDVGD
jgi:hypothetical protein